MTCYSSGIKEGLDSNDIRQHFELLINEDLGSVPLCLYEWRQSIKVQENTVIQEHWRR